MYFGKKPSSAGMGSGVTTFYTGEAEDCNTITQFNSEVGYLTKSGKTHNVKSSVNG